MYGTETATDSRPVLQTFENDVKMYGTETEKEDSTGKTKFENCCGQAFL